MFHIIIARTFWLHNIGWQPSPYHFVFILENEEKPLSADRDKDRLESEG
jgi:hypothetical protein